MAVLNIRVVDYQTGAGLDGVLISDENSMASYGITNASGNAAINISQEVYLSFSKAGYSVAAGQSFSPAECYYYSASLPLFITLYSIGGQTLIPNSEAAGAGAGAANTGLDISRAINNVLNVVRSGGSGLEGVSEVVGSAIGAIGAAAGSAAAGAGAGAGSVAAGAGAGAGSAIGAIGAAAGSAAAGAGAGAGRAFQGLFTGMSGLLLLLVVAYMLMRKK